METYIDLIKEMSTMNKAEQFVIASILADWKPSSSIGEVFIKVTDMNRSDTNKFISGYKSLALKNIIRKTKRSHYIIHPKGLPPRDKELALETWEKL